MSESSSPAQRTRQSRTTMVTFLGAVVRPLGSWMPISGAVDLLSQFGLDAPSIRTAVHRLKQNRWLAPEVRDGFRGYALTPTALDTLAAGDQVIWHTRQPADLTDGWCIVHFGVPERLRTKRHQLRAHLTHLGFGNIGTAMWIAPARMREPAEHAVRDLGLTATAAIFVGDYHGTRDLTELLYDSWDLAAIDGSYRDFIDEHATRADHLEQNPPAGTAAFTTYLQVLDQWRKLPFRDPGLPGEVLAPGWSAPAAVALFERLVDVLGKPALEHAATRWPTSPARGVAAPSAAQ